MREREKRVDEGEDEKEEREENGSKVMVQIFTSASKYDGLNRFLRMYGSEPCEW